MLNLKHEDGKTALILDAYFGRLEIVKLLIKAGADVNLKDEDGKTAYAIAKKQRHEDVIILLKPKGNHERNR